MSTAPSSVVDRVFRFCISKHVNASFAVQQQGEKHTFDLWDDILQISGRDGKWRNMLASNEEVSWAVAFAWESSSGPAGREADI